MQRRKKVHPARFAAAGFLFGLAMAGAGAESTAHSALWLPGKLAISGFERTALFGRIAAAGLTRNTLPACRSVRNFPRYCFSAENLYGRVTRFSKGASDYRQGVGRGFKAPLRPV